jgi:hypothetical protein
MPLILNESARYATQREARRLAFIADRRNSVRVKIVIYGLGKSGTSALFYKVKSSLPKGTIALFEPSSFGLRERAEGRARALLRGRVRPDVLAKVLPCDPRPVRVRDFDRFDRQVLIVRDPRDWLLSALLYRSYHAGGFHADPEAGAFLELLRRKEADPRSVPVISLLHALERAQQAASPAASSGRFPEQALARLLAFHAERRHLPFFRYEQMVDGDFRAAEDILGFPLTGSSTLPQSLWRVVRTKGYGAWRDWFTQADMETFRPVLRPFLDRYYPGSDWDLSPSPSLDPDQGSRYVERLINEKRELLGLPRIAPGA